METKRNLPDWVIKYKTPGTQIVKNGNNYYISKISSKWDPVKKRAKKITDEYLGKITPKGIIPPKNKLTSLNKDDKTLRDLQILKDLEGGKDKTSLAKKYNINLKTIINIQERFNKDGLKGLIHIRESKKEEIIKISKNELSIVTELIQNPEKEAKEIKKSLNLKTSIKKIESLILPIKNSLKLKKKLILEIKN